jgi:hypothetical protein
MAYIGNSPANTGNYQIVDNIASGFNGSATSFALTSGSIAITPAKSGQLLASINGVLQQPDDSGSNGFKVSGSNIVFSSAPASGDVFWSVYQGQNVDIGTPSDDVVDTAHIKNNAITADKIAAGAVVADIATGGITTAKIADDAVTADKLANSINTAIAANTAKTGITTSQANAITANTAKTGITSSQASAITANTAKTGITSSQATAITAALPKAGGTMTGNLKLNDNVKLEVGSLSGGDLRIYHDSTAGASYIKEVGTGSLQIAGSANVNILNGADTEYCAKFITDGAVELYHNNVKKLETTADGATISGGSSTAANLTITSTAADDNIAPDLILYRNSASPADNDNLGGLEWQGNHSGGGINSYAQITCMAEDVTDGTEDASLRFYTATGGSNSEKMRINSAGKVGIGTTSIDERLHVQGGDHERIQIESTVAGDAVIIHKNTVNYWKVGVTASVGGYGGDGKYSIADGDDIRFAISPTNGEITNPSGIYKTTPSSTTATGWNFDTSGAVITCVQNAAIKLGNCGASGFLLINDTTLNGQMAGLFTGGGRFDFVGYSGSWVSSSSPSTSQVGFYRDGSQIYVKNGQAGTVQLGLMTFRTRSGQ